ncbi:MAG: AAA family ATPase [Cyanobacteria bacterium HKST-UBA04]|nr:AAA family ATPase [Cyanobacteria bacterium HKST-UBA04]
MISTAPSPQSDTMDTSSSKPHHVRDHDDPTIPFCQGRSREQKRLLDILKACRQGEGSAVLITGAEGIGKSTLIEALMHQAYTTHRNQLRAYTRTLSLNIPLHPAASVDELTGRLADELDLLAKAVFEYQLDQVSDDLHDLGLQWTTRQFIELYEPIFDYPTQFNNPDAIGLLLKEKLSKALPFLKRVNMGAERKLDGIIDHLNSPWSILYAGFRTGRIDGYEALLKTIRPEALPVFDPVAPRPLNPKEFEATLTHAQVLAVSVAACMNAISRILAMYQQAFIVSLDQFDSLAEAPVVVQQATKAFISSIIGDTVGACEHQAYHGLIVVACRSEQESYLLNDGLMDLFNHHLLLGPLAFETQQTLLTAHLDQQGIVMEEGVSDAILQLTRGNPGWIAVANNLLNLPTSTQPATTEPNAVQHVINFKRYREHFAVNHPGEWIDLLLNQLRLAFVGDRIPVEPLLTKMVNRFNRSPFSLDSLSALFGDAIDEADLSTFLNMLIGYGFVEPYFPHHPNFENHYWFVSAFYFSALQRQLCSTEPGLSNEDKVSALKRIVPLAIESGQMDYERVISILTMAASLDNADLVTFLEQALTQACQASSQNDSDTADTASGCTNPSGLLGGLAALAGHSQSPQALNTLVDALRHEQADVRLAACQQLGQCLAYFSNADSSLLTPIAERLCVVAAKDSGPVKAAAYAVLAQNVFLAQHTSVEQFRSIFEQGLRLDNDTIQLISIRGLSSLGIQSIELLHVIQTLLNHDGVPTQLAQAALEALTTFEKDHLMPVLVDFLETQPEHALWGQALSLMLDIDPATASPWLGDALLSDRMDVDTKLSIVRSLGSTRNTDYERLLCNFLNTAAQADQPAIEPELRWMAIRSLGWIGSGMDAYNTIRNQLPHSLDDPIVEQTIRQTLITMGRRLSIDKDDLVTVDIHADPTTPTTHASAPPLLAQSGLASADSAPLEEAIPSTANEPWTPSTGWVEKERSLNDIFPAQIG